MPPVLRGALLCAAFVAFPAGALHADSQRPAGNALMLAFARAMRGLDGALARRDPDALADHARALGAAAADSTGLRPQKNVDAGALFRDYRAAVGSLAGEMETLAQRRDLDGAAQVLHEVRQTCIACHMTFRLEKDLPAEFPRDGNVVCGEVRIVDVDGKERGDRANVLIFLDGVRGVPRSEPARRQILSQKDRKFAARVLPVVRGTTVDFPNDDTIFHNVFSLSQTRPFDLDIYQPGESRSVSFPNSGLVKVYCNIHPQMVSNIVVLENPYYSVTNAKGVFVISGVPDGTYALRTWHEFGSPTTQRLEIGGETVRSFALEVRETVRCVAHHNKFGQPYRTDY